MLDVLTNMTLFSFCLCIFIFKDPYIKPPKAIAKNCLPSLVGADKALVKSKEMTTKLICFFFVIFPLENCHSCFSCEPLFFISDKIY